MARPKGIPYTQEQKDKMSRIAKEKGFGKWMTGKKHSDSTKIKMSAQRKGRKGYWLGKKQPLSMIQKRVKKIKGLTRSEETKRKMSLRQYREKNLNWKGGKTHNGEGYVLIKES